jgi:molecular chaperone HtpG
MKEKSSKLEFRLEAAGLIKLLAQNLYPDPDVFLREIIQNALDSLIRRQASDEANQPLPYIRVTCDSSANEIDITDNGAGFSAADVEQYLTTIGKSSTHDLRAHILGTDREQVEALIGQFGIGLLSAFLVAEKMTVTSKARGKDAIHWETDGTDRYVLQSAERDEIGTSVRLKIPAANLQYLDVNRIRWIVRTYVDFLGVPVYLNDETHPTNSVRPPWRTAYASPKECDAAYVSFWNRRYAAESALHIFALDDDYEWDDASQVDGKGRGKISGVLGIIDKRTLDQSDSGTIDLYRRNVLIAPRYRELLPPWARFIQGVVECNDLIPTAARNGIIRNTTSAAVETALGRSIARQIGLLATNNDPRFLNVVRWHAEHLLTVGIQDAYEDFFRAIADFVPLESDLGPMAVAEYLRSAPVRTDGSRAVYYITTPSSANEFILLASARGMRVFNCSNAHAERFLERYARTWPERVHLTRLDAAPHATLFEALSPDDRERFAELQAAYSFIFLDSRCIARVSRFQPSEIPAVLSRAINEPSAHPEITEVASRALPEYIRDTIKNLLSEDQPPPLVLHLNAENSIVQTLAGLPNLRDEIARHALISLFNNACMLMQPLRIHDAQTIYMQNNQLIERFLSLARGRAQLERTLNARETELEEYRALENARSIRDQYVSCFVALPFRDNRAIEIFGALRSVLEDKPWFWRVVRADDNVERDGLWENLKQKLLRAHCFVAVLAGDLNPNVMIEIGRMEALERPILLLRAAGAPELPADLHGRLYEEVYESGDSLISEIRNVLSRQNALLGLRGVRYLSEAVLKRYAKLDGQTSKEISRRYSTWEAFIESDSNEIAAQVGLSPVLIDAIKVTLADAAKRPD